MRPGDERAAALATSNQARLSVVHVVEPMAMAFGGDVPMDLSMLQQQQFDQARERLDAFAVRIRTSAASSATWSTGNRARKSTASPRNRPAT